MYSWNNSDVEDSKFFKYSNFLVFGAGAGAALIIAVILNTFFADLFIENPIIINILYVPAFVIGFLYGLKITEKAIHPSETRSALKRKIMKVFLFFLVIGGLFSSVSFALHGGAFAPEMSLTYENIIPWTIELITSNGGVTFLIVSSITIMAAATRRIVGLGGGIVSKFITFAGTFGFFTMISLSLTQSDPTNSQVFLYAFYHAGILGGAMYQMNRLTANLNKWEDYMNGS
ncbi:MAG TPA: hypothetical protein QF710_02680 [Candidatus Nitrosopelagicus sp.]|nr:hypothetical protein [Candidatus Nitrosopelagicus sp.]